MQGKADRPGIDPAQRRARVGAGIEVPSTLISPPSRSATGGYIVALECDHCGCTNAWASTKRIGACGFSGKGRRAPRVGGGW